MQMKIRKISLWKWQYIEQTFDFFVLEIENHRLILANYTVLAQTTAERGINLKLMHVIYNMELN